MKYCPDCKKSLPLDSFGNNKSSKDGKQFYCKIHSSERVKKSTNSAKAVEKTRQWRKLNPKLYKAQVNRQIANRDKEKINFINRLNYKLNRDKILQKQREWTKNNRDRKRRYIQNWRVNNPDKYKALSQKRRSRETSGEHFTMLEWVTLCKKYNYQCLSCKRKIKLTVDHVVPLSKGGSNSIENCQPLCLSCNSRKGVNIIDYRY